MNINLDLNPIHTIAIEAAQKAGAYLLENHQKLSDEAVEEKAKNDFVSYIDRTSEQLIIEHIRATFPEHRFLGEEGGEQPSNSSFSWIIDPLDGTHNFIRHLPFFCVSIAFMERDTVRLAVVYAPFQNEMFTALHGNGAYLNGQRIQVNPAKDISRAFLATGFPHHSKAYLPLFVNAFADIFHQSAGIRRLGSAALDLCYTACGRFDGFWELGLKPWDIAGGSLLIEEAGGIISDFWGGASYLDSGFVLAGNPDIHKALQTILSHHFIRPERILSNAGNSEATQL